MSSELTCSSEDENEDERAGHQARVPRPLGLVNSRDTEEDEDDGFGNACQSLHCVLHRRTRLLRNICLHIFVGTDATEGHPDNRMNEALLQ